MTDLKMLNQDEVAELINVSRDQVAMLREVGIIRATKAGNKIISGNVQRAWCEQQSKSY